MKLSNYSLWVDDYPNEGEHLLYHTRTQALIKVGSEMKEILFRLKDPSLTVTPSQEEDIKRLFHIGVVVRDEADDRERLERFMEQKKYGIDKSSFMATILTTYNCNFACTYCFEESTRASSQKLDSKTSDDIMVWLKRKVERLGVRSLDLNFYGGEPLLNQPMLEYIASTMKVWCEERGTKFKMMMQTNGALLTPELVDRYLMLGLYRVQVSLDGTREVHDRQRPMRGSGQGTFDLVIRNLQAVADKVNVMVAAGYDKGDPTGIIELLDYLDKIGLLKKLKKFSYSPIHPTLGPKGHTEQIVSPGCLNNYKTETLLQAESRIKEVMEKKGLFTKSGLSASMCPVTTGDGSVTIDTQGLIFKCNAMLGHPELAVGSIYEQEYNDRHHSFMAADAWKKCDADCPYAPLCNTGCRLFSFFQSKDFSAKSCERSYMDRFVPEAVKKEYQNQLALRERPKVPPKEILV